MNPISKPPTQLERVRTWVSQTATRYGLPATIKDKRVTVTPWFSLSELANAVAASETAASARLRDLRKQGYSVTTHTIKVGGRTLVQYQVSAAPVCEFDSEMAQAKRVARRKEVREIAFRALQNAPSWAGNFAKAIDISRALVP